MESKQTEKPRDEIKLFVELTESQYNEMKSILAEAADNDRRLTQMIQMVKAAIGHTKIKNTPMTVAHGIAINGQAAADLLEFALLVEGQRK